MKKNNSVGHLYIRSVLDLLHMHSKDNLGMCSSCVFIALTDYQVPEISIQNQ